MIRRFPSACHPAFDRLDARCLLTAQLTATLTQGVLTVRGTPAADVIAVQVQEGNVTVAGLDRTFPTGKIRRIEILGGRGDDTITVSGASLPVRIRGGVGNDTINGRSDITPASNLASIVAAIPAPAPATTPTPLVPVAATPVPAVPALPVAVAPSLTASVQRIVDLTNAERLAAGLTPLTLSTALTQAATIQSGNMAQLDVMSHELPGTNAPELADRAAAVGYHYSYLGENIAWNYADADAVVAGWMASPGHRANILNPHFTEIGVAIATNGSGEPYYTQEFGDPL